MVQRWVNTDLICRGKWELAARRETVEILKVKTVNRVGQENKAGLFVAS